MLAYLLNLATLMAINAILAVTLNFIMGYAGIYSLAHAIFFGIGGYVAAWFSMHVSGSFLLAVPAAMLVAAVVSMVLALPALRVRGEYFLAASLGLQVFGVAVFADWTSFTGGLGGMIGIPPAKIFELQLASPWQALGLALSCLALVVVITGALLRSSFGRNLKAIRDSESAAQAYGKNVAVIKTLSVIISSSLAAIAGAVYAFYLGFINTESFGLDTSVLLMAMVIIGGTGTLLGPILGTVLLMLLPSLFSYLTFVRPTNIGLVQQIAYGLAMVLLMIFRPSGLVGHGGHAKSGGLGGG